MIIFVIGAGAFTLFSMIWNSIDMLLNYVAYILFGHHRSAKLSKLGWTAILQISAR